MAQINNGHATANVNSELYNKMYDEYVKATNDLSWADHEMNRKLAKLDAAKNLYDDAKSQEASMVAQYNYDKLAHETAEEEYWDYKEKYDNGEGSADVLEQKRVAMMTKWNTLILSFNNWANATNELQSANEKMNTVQEEYETAKNNVQSIKDTITVYTKKLALLTKNATTQDEFDKLRSEYNIALNESKSAKQALNSALKDLDDARAALDMAKSEEANVNAQYEYNESLHEKAQDDYDLYKEKYDNGEGSAEVLEQKRVAMMDAWNVCVLSFKNLADTNARTIDAQEVLSKAETDYNAIQTQANNAASLTKDYAEKIQTVSFRATNTKFTTTSETKSSEPIEKITYTDAEWKTKTSALHANTRYNTKIRNIPSINDNVDSGLVSSAAKSVQDVYANNLIFPITKQNWYNKINRYGWIDPYNHDKVVREFLFFTKPDLSLYGTYTSDGGVNGGRYGMVGLRSDMSNPIIVETSKRMPYVLTQLQSSVTDPDGKVNPFMYILTNAVKSKLDLPAISTDSQESTSNIMGTSIHYRGHSYKSDNGYDFSLSFTDTAYLEIYHMVKCYDEYIRMIKIGTIAPYKKYILDRVIPEQFSIYKFLVGSDGETILYYAKLTGCYFTDVPRSDMADPGDEIKFSLSFHAQFVEDMNPQILKEFSILTNYAKSRSSAKNLKYLDVYNTDMGIVDNKWATYPTIIKATSNGDSNYSKRVARRNVKYDYFLKWIK